MTKVAMSYDEERLGKLLGTSKIFELPTYRIFPRIAWIVASSFGPCWSLVALPLTRKRHCLNLTGR